MRPYLLFVTFLDDYTYNYTLRQRTFPCNNRVVENVGVEPLN
jgi:hypothetical protein